MSHLLVNTESWVYVAGGGFCKNSKGEEIRCCPGEVILVSLSVCAWLQLMSLQKHQDAFASAFGFFLIGFDAISKYSSPVGRSFFALTDPVLWFFKVSKLLIREAHPSSLLPEPCTDIICAHAFSIAVHVCQ